MKREFLDYVDDIIGATDDAMGFVEGMSYDEFARDKKTIYAVVRAVEIIGEAVKKIPDSIRKKYPWRQFAKGLENSQRRHTCLKTFI